MPESTIEWFDLSRECLTLVMQSCGDQMFIGFEKICAIAHGRQVPQLREKFSSGFDWSTITDKAKHFANSGIDCCPDPAFRFFLATKLQSSSISIKEHALVLGWSTGSRPAAWTSQRETILWCTPRIRPMALSPSPSRYSFWACSLKAGSLPLRIVWKVRRQAWQR